ncbi:MAG TPA: DNA/RNA nuclease SfsA [Dehalococcoidia bacterium]
MRLQGVLVPGRVRRRLNRFAVEVETEGGPAVAHLANSGRLTELLQPGTRALLRPAPAGLRRTTYDLALVWYAGGWVSVDARLPNAVVAEALAKGALAPFRGYPQVRREVRWGECRLDFLLEGPQGRCLLETKSVTLVEAGCALFPDAPTLRGARHVRTLTAARLAGERAAVLFLIQRPDATRFRPHPTADPALLAALREAAAAGVELYAYRCVVSPEAMEVLDAVPVEV